MIAAPVIVLLVSSLAVANAVRHGVGSQSGRCEVVVVGSDRGLEVEVLPGFVGGVCAG